VRPRETAIYPARIINVHDGDTVQVEARQSLAGLSTWLVVTIRLVGMNTPELRVRKQTNPAGVASLAHMAELIGNARRLELSTAWETDKYGGRWLGDLLVDGRSVVARMIEDGHALPWNGKGKKPLMPGWE
jgi:endonuclease YncB( thermonuclease family)